MTRSESLKLWQAVARGSLEDPEYGPFDLHGWIRGVAAKIVEADGVSSVGSRSNNITRAAGLNGQDDPHSELRQFIYRYAIFFEFADPSNPDAEVTLAEKVRTTLNAVRAHDEKLYGLARKQGAIPASLLLRGVYEVDDKKARDLVRKILRESNFF